MQLECGKFKILFQLKNYEVHSCKWDALFPSRGFFNEVTQVKKKFKKTLSQLFLFSQCKAKTKKQKQRLKASSGVGVARMRRR